MDNAVYECENLAEEDVSFLERIEGQMGILSDISRADVLLYACTPPNTKVASHAQPHSITPVYGEPQVGKSVDSRTDDLVLTVLETGRPREGLKRLMEDSAPVVRLAMPVNYPPDSQRVIGVLSIETNAIEKERHTRRSPIFRRAIRQLQEMVRTGVLEGTESISHFGEYEGIIVSDLEGNVRYASGIATNLYRKLGYVESLLGVKLESLETSDNDLATIASIQRRCVEREVREGGRVLVRKAIPLLEVPFAAKLRQTLRLGKESLHLTGLLLTMRDITEMRRKEQEIIVKTAMIQEVHHRVKNNLQTIASLLRLQARRMSYDEGRTSVEEAVSRIQSVAVIHEFLSRASTNSINVRDVGQRIISQIQQGVLEPGNSISFDVRGTPVFLPSRQATACAMVINELLQNAVEHGFEGRESGSIVLVIYDEGDSVIINVSDDGGGLPPGFTLDGAHSLGLQIVQTLVKEDLSGEFMIKDRGEGVSAIVTFPKPIGGEE